MYHSCIEKIECLRYLENGISIRMILTQYMGIQIGVPSDLVRAECIVYPKKTR